MTTNAKVGFVGLGVMGKSMARNIMKAGFPLAVHNRSRPPVEELVAAGARDGGSPAGVAAASDIICLCVPDTPDVEKVLFGPDGVANDMKQGSVVIDCSTISATATMDFAQRLKAHGVLRSLVAQPSGRGAPDAADGGRF